MPLPPLAEQHRIVAKVDELFAQTRALEAKLRQAQADIVTANRAALHRLHTAQDDDQFQAAWRTLRDHFDLLYDDPRNVAELRQAILDLAVRGKLVPQDAEDEPAGELLKRIARQKGQMGVPRSLELAARPRSKGRNELPKRLPETWEWVSIGEISDHRLGKMLDKHKNRGEYRPYLRNINVQWDRIDLSDVQEMRFEPGEFDEYQLRNGDLLICEGGEPGRCAIWSYMDKTMMFQKAIHRVRPYGDIIPRYLLFHFWADARNGRLEKYFTGATIKHFTGKALTDYPIALPPSAEQHRIVAKVDQLMRLCDALQAGLVRAEMQRRSLTAAVLSGICRQAADSPV